MASLIRQGARHPGVRRHAETAVAGVPPAMPEEEARAVGRYVSRIADYRLDPEGMELLRTPWYVFECEVERGRRPQLDCDDLTMVSMAMLGSLGRRVGMRVVSTRPDRRFNHVFGIVRIGAAWAPLDITRAWLPPDVSPPPMTRQFDLEV